MIYTSGVNRILSLDEANSNDPVGWAVNTDDGHVLFSDNRTKAGWSGNSSNFSYGVGATLDSNYCTMPTIPSDSGDWIKTIISYLNSKEELTINIEGTKPWFVSVAPFIRTNDVVNLTTRAFQNFNNLGVVHYKTLNFYGSNYFQQQVHIGGGNFGMGTVGYDGSWRLYFQWGGANYYFEPFNLNYANTSSLNERWNPSSTPSGYSVSPNCVRPLSYNATMESSGKAYTITTNALFKMPLYASVYCDSYHNNLRQIFYSVYIGDLYTQYPSGTSYFIGNGREIFTDASQTLTGATTFILILHAGTGSITLPYSGSVSSSGTLALSEGNYRGTASISATNSGENVITQTN